MLLQEVHFIMFLSTATAMESLSHRKPAFARNMEHFKTSIKSKLG